MNDFDRAIRETLSAEDSELFNRLGADQALHRQVLATFQGQLRWFNTIGWIAPVILLLCRLAQGISTGVEAPLSTAYGVEIMPTHRSGLTAGIISSFVNVGVMLGSLVPFLVTLWQTL